MRANLEWYSDNSTDSETKEIRRKQLKKKNDKEDKKKKLAMYVPLD